MNKSFITILKLAAGSVIFSLVLAGTAAAQSMSLVA